MIEMTYSQASNFEFIRSMQKLAQTPMDPKAAYSIKRIADKLNSQRKAISEEYQKQIVELYAVKDENGGLKMKEDGNGFVIVDGKEEEFKAQEKLFGEKTFKIERNKLHIEMLTAVKLSAAELSVLDPILADPEAGSPAPVVPLHG